MIAPRPPAEPIGSSIMGDRPSPASSEREPQRQRPLHGRRLAWAAIAVSLGVFWAVLAAAVAGLLGSAIDVLTGTAIAAGVALVVAVLGAPAMLASGEDDGR